MHRGIAATLAAAVVLGCSMASADPRPLVLVNHIGYDVHGSKKVVVQSASDAGYDAFQVVDPDDRVVFEGKLAKAAAVDRWSRGVFSVGTFSQFQKPGTYRVVATGRGGRVTSQPFMMAPKLLPEASISEVLFYLKGQRSSGLFDKTDRSVPFFGESGSRSAYGGWFDASGDTSKYLSHLSYANYMNPQQTPLVVWALLEAASLLKDVKNARLNGLEWRLHDEALHGADFLEDAGSGWLLLHHRLRQVDQGFEATRDQRVRDTGRDQVIGLPGRLPRGRRNGHRRPGGASTLTSSGEFPLSAVSRRGNQGVRSSPAAQRPIPGRLAGEHHRLLRVAGGDGLYHAAKKEEFLNAARQRRASLVKRLSNEKFDGFWRADARGARPFFHASDAGLPVVALLRYASVESDSAMREEALNVVRRSLQFELPITSEVPNPFGYARQCVKDLNKGTRSAFFFPHQNESSYWWQGRTLASARLRRRRSSGRVTSRDSCATIFAPMRSISSTGSSA